jgi:Tfp pilus assembly protein PilF
VGRLLTALFCLSLAACAGAPLAPPQPESVLHDRLFAPPAERVSAEDVFALSDEMRRYLDTEIAAQLQSKGKYRGLFDALYSKGQLKLDYDAAITRNAAQAFAARSGNCLSLVIMTAAFARALDIEVQYQSALIEDSWSRSGNLYLRSGHVNLTLGRRIIDARTRRDDTPLKIDFLPPEEIRGLRTRVIAEQTVVGMYLNNRSAELLARGQLNDAYWWVRAAVLHSPTFLSAYNTLGVVYLRQGALAQAAQVLGYVLEREPANTSAMSNLAHVLRLQGRAAEADALAHKLAQIEPYPPFHFFNLGMAALQRGDNEAARDLFAKEVARDSYYHEFHFWLGIAHHRLGEARKARKHLQLAIENSTTRRDQDLYSGKLAWIKAQQH